MNDRESAPLRPVPDLAGTPVSDAGGLPIGSLFGALAEAETGLIRYFDLALADDRRHVLVPVGHARLIEGPNGNALRLRAAVRADLDDIPTFDRTTKIDDGWQDHLLAALGRCFHGERYYAHPAYDHSGFYAGPHPIVPESGVPGEMRRASSLETEHAARAPIGRALIGLAGASIGRITDVLVTPAAGARYIEVEDATRRRTLLPVGYVRGAADDGTLRAPGLTADDLAALPESRGIPDFEAERALMQALEARFAGQRRYVRPDFLFEC